MNVNHEIQIDDNDLDISFARSGGPGGQNVNKVSSKAILRWNVYASEALPAGVRARFLEKYSSRLTKDGDLILQSQKYRDQGRNVVDCMNRLRDMILSVATAPRKRRKTRPSAGARQRRLNDKKRTSEKKQSRRRPRMD